MVSSRHQRVPSRMLGCCPADAFIQIASLSVGLGFFCRRQDGAAGYQSVALVWGPGLILGQGYAAWPEKDSADTNLGKCPFHGMRIHLSSPLGHVPIYWEGRLKEILQCWKFPPQVLHLSTGLATQQHAQCPTCWLPQTPADPVGSQEGYGRCAAWKQGRQLMLQSPPLVPEGPTRSLPSALRT